MRVEWGYDHCSSLNTKISIKSPYIVSTSGSDHKSLWLVQLLFTIHEQTLFHFFSFFFSTMKGAKTSMWLTTFDTEITRRSMFFVWVSIGWFSKLSDGRSVCTAIIPESALHFFSWGLSLESHTELIMVNSDCSGLPRNCDLCPWISSVLYWHQSKAGFCFSRYKLSFHLIDHSAINLILIAK